MVSNLDAAILSTVENLETSREDLASVIDQALRNSLWRRTLDRRSVDEQVRQRRVLIGRAEWIWDRTTGANRRGFFASGIGFDAGTALDTNIHLLARLVATADVAVEVGDMSGASGALAQVEELLEQVRPFGSPGKPVDWRDLLAAWIAGESVADVRQEAGEFIQDGLVYRLVWAVEAIRAYAESVGARDEGSWGGQASVALTYGVPTGAAAALIRHGLPSRRLAVEISERYPPPADGEIGLEEWIDALPDTVDPDTFKDSRDGSLWVEFTSPSTTRVRRWQRTELSAEAVWTADLPSPGLEVRLVPDGLSSTTVCGRDLTPLGQIGRRLDYITRAVVGDHGEVRAERFGPPA